MHILSLFGVNVLIFLAIWFKLQLLWVDVCAFIKYSMLFRTSEWTMLDKAVLCA